MTLLSIREQEAVKKAAVQLQFHFRNLRNGYGTALAHDDGTPNLGSFDAYTQAVILATRDAIARQVRIEAREHHYNESWLHAAAFIEGLE